MRIRKESLLLSTKAFVIFFSFLILTFVAAVIFVPIDISDAGTKTASVEAGSYTIAMSTNDNIPISIIPTTSQTVYTGSSAISFNNTCPFGFRITISSSSSNTSLVRTGEGSAPKTIPTFTSGTSLADNTWGYSINNGSTYNQIPALDNPSIIIDTSTSSTNTSLNIVYGVKTDNTIPSGKYSNDIVYTISAKPQCLTYEITWDFNEGTAKEGASYPGAVNFGATIDLSAITPTRAGYVFSGWSNGVTTFPSSSGATDVNPNNYSSITLTAQWTKIMAENMQYAAPSGVPCADAQCMIEYLEDKI